MAVVTRHEPGSFCWPELATSDSAGAKKFYAGLFAWAANDSPAGPDMIYTMLQKSGKSVGALYQMGAQQKGMPPHWGIYIAVASADAAAKKAKELGGTILMEPFDVMDLGRMAVIQDKQGAVFSVWEAKKHIGAEVMNEPGALCWAELDTTDMASAEKFYTALFGWGAKRGGDAANETPYTEWQRGGDSIGGMMTIPKEWGPVPPNWLVYFMVSDVDATTKKAGSLGGQAIVPPSDIPKTGRFSVIRDPQGAVFATFKPEM
jgi:uncharacterized protein